MVSPLFSSKQFKLLPNLILSENGSDMMFDASLDKKEVFQNGSDIMFDAGLD